MKSFLLKTLLALVLVAIGIGISTVMAFNTGPYYPGGAPATLTDKIGITATPQAKEGSLRLGIPESIPVTAGTTLDILGGMFTTGATIDNNMWVSGKLRVGSAPTGGLSDVATLSNPVSVGSGHIVYDTKKPVSTRVMCTDNDGVLAPCGDVETVVITGADYNTVTKNRTISYLSIQGNQAALSGLLSAGGQQTASTGCGFNSSWGSTSPFNLSVSAKTGC